MAGQEHINPKRRDEEEDEQPEAPSTDNAQADTEGVDDLLDEIDDVLETNAESFVRSFVQKGGE